MLCLLFHQVSRSFLPGLETVTRPESSARKHIPFPMRGVRREMGEVHSPEESF
jgi:hypothetical protein